MEEDIVRMDEGKFILLDVAGEKIKTHYYELGAGVKETVVLVQTGGNGTSAYMCWHLNIEALAQAGYHLYAPDSVGFGWTHRVGGWSLPGKFMEIGPKFLLAFVDALGIKSAHFIGNSMGTSVIVRFAIEEPERIESLVLSGGEPRVETEESRAIAETLGRTERMDFVRAMLSKPEVSFEDMRKATMDNFHDVHNPRIDEVARMRLDMVNRPGMREIERDFAFEQIKSGRMHIPATDLAMIRAPTYLIHGRDEQGYYKEKNFVLLEHALKLAWVVPHGSCTVLAHCGHWPQIEKAERFNVLVLEFLRSITA